MLKEEQRQRRGVETTGTLTVGEVKGHFPIESTILRDPTKSADPVERIRSLETLFHRTSMLSRSR